MFTQPALNVRKQIVHDEPTENFPKTEIKCESKVVPNSGLWIYGGAYDLEIIIKIEV